MHAAPSPRRPLRVAVLEDNALLRESLQALLEKEGVEVALAAPVAPEALAVLVDARCEAVLLYCTRTVGELVHVIQGIQHLRGQPAVILLETPPQEEAVEALLHAGARGILSRGADPAEVVASLDAVDRFGAYVDPEIMTLLIRRVRAPVPHPEQPVLTRREHEIMRLVAEGLRIHDVAERLGLCDGTIKAHLHNAYRKLETDNRMQAVQRAREKLLI